MLETKKLNLSTKIGHIEFQSEELTKEFLDSAFWKNYLHSDSFKESVRLFLQVKFKIKLDSKEQEQVRRIFMSEVAKAFESKNS